MPKSQAMEQMREQYKRLYSVFKSNDLEVTPFASRLKGESDPNRVRDGLIAMRNFLITQGCLENDPEVRSVPKDNRPEYDLACREFV